MSDVSHTRSARFTKGDPAWLRPIGKRGMRYACDGDPKSPFHTSELEIVHVVDKGGGSYLYRANLKNNTDKTILDGFDECFATTAEHMW